MGYLFSGGLHWDETHTGDVGFISLWQCCGLHFMAGVSQILPFPCLLGHCPPP